MQNCPKEAEAKANSSFGANNELGFLTYLLGHAKNKALHYQHEEVTGLPFRT